MESKPFEIGQHVVYPAHGVGVVQGVEEQEIAGTKLKVLSILFEKDKMIVRLPLSGSTSKNVRPLCTKEEMQKAIETLRTRTKSKKMMWSRRAQEYEAKINSGDIVSISQVVRDLYRSPNQPEHSYSERQIYQEALDRLIKEYAAIERIGEEAALEKLKEAMAA